MVNATNFAMRGAYLKNTNWITGKNIDIFRGCCLYRI